MRKIIIISAFVMFSLVLTGCGNQTQQNTATTSQTNASSVSTLSKADKIEIVDFHGTHRCYSCQTIEKYAKETVEEYFQKELADDKITFQSINGESAENQATVVKYQARGSSLFINTIRDGKENIEEDTTVWRLVGDEQKFKAYFKGRIDALLN